jgi:hypothetical protein
VSHGTIVPSKSHKTDTSDPERKVGFSSLAFTVRPYE